MSLLWEDYGEGGYWNNLKNFNWVEIFYFWKDLYKYYIKKYNKLIIQNGSNSKDKENWRKYRCDLTGDEKFKGMSNVEFVK